MSKVRQVDDVTPDNTPDLSDIVVSGAHELVNISKDYHLVAAALPMRHFGSKFMEVLGAFGSEHKIKLCVRRVIFPKPILLSDELGDLNKMLLAIPKEYSVVFDDYIDTVAFTDIQKASLSRLHVSKLSFDSNVAVSAINVSIGDKAYALVPANGYLSVVSHYVDPSENNSFLVALRHGYDDPYLFAGLKLDENYFAQSNE